MSLMAVKSKTGQSGFVRIAVIAVALMAMGFSPVFADLATDLVSLTDFHRVKMLWVRKTVKNAPANWTGSPSWLLAFDSNEPTGERKLVSTSGRFVKPILTPNADYVVYTEVIGGNPYDSTNWSGDIYSIKWDGTAKTKILDKSAGYMAQDVWKDPATGVLWVALSCGNGKKIAKIRFDGTSTAPIVLYSNTIDLNFSISGNGKYIGGGFPWPATGILNVASQTVNYTSDQTGCTVNLSNDTLPGDSLYYFSMLTSDHSRIHIYHGLERGNTTKVATINWAAKWNETGTTPLGPTAFARTDPHYMVTNYAIGGSGENNTANIYFCKLNAAFNDFDAMVNVSLSTGPGVDCQWPECWIDPLPSVIINPSTLSFVMDENGASPTSKKISAKDGANATITAMTATSNQTWLTVAVSGDSISNTVIGTGVPSGLDTAVVSIYSSGNIKAKYNVYLRVNAPAYLATISIMPGTISLKSGESQQFTVTAKDQFRAPFTGTLTWSTVGGQTITQSGLFTMGSTPARSVVTVGGANGLSASADVAVTPSTLEPLFWGAFSKMLALEDSTGNYHIMGKTITQALLPGETQNGFNGYIPTKDAPVKIDGKTYYWRQDSTSGFGGDWMTDTSKSGFSSYFGMMVYSTRDRYVKIHSGHGDGVRVWVNGKLVLSNNAGAGEYTDTFMLKTGENIMVFKHAPVGKGWAFWAFKNPDDSYINDLSFSYTPSYGDKRAATTSEIDRKIFGTGDTLRIKWAMETAADNGVRLQISPDAGMNWYDMTDGNSIAPTDLLWGNYPWVVQDSILNPTTDVMVSLLDKNLLLRVRGYNDASVVGYAIGTFRIEHQETAIIDNNSIMKQRGVARLNVMRNRIMVTVPTASTIIIRDVLGRTLLSQQIVGQTTVSTAGFARGIYYIELQSNRQRLHKMFCQM